MVSTLEMVAFSPQAMQAAAEARYEAACHAFRAAAPALGLDPETLDAEAFYATPYLEDHTLSSAQQLLQRRHWQALRQACRELLEAYDALATTVM